MKTRKSVQLAAVVLTALTVACSRNAPAGSGADSSLVASLERGPCRGFCPEYRVEVFESGRVTFDGRKNVKTTGMRTSSVSADAVRDLLRAVGATAFASADSAYTYGSSNCGQFYTDQPVVVLAARVGTRLKSVTRDPGCNGAPGYLKTLEARVDSLAGTMALISGK